MRVPQNGWFRKIPFSNGWWLEVYPHFYRNLHIIPPYPTILPHIILLLLDIVGYSQLWVPSPPTPSRCSSLPWLGSRSLCRVPGRSSVSASARRRSKPSLALEVGEVGQPGKVVGSKRFMKGYIRFIHVVVLYVCSTVHTLLRFIQYTTYTSIHNIN